MKTVEEVLQKYTLGEAGKDETNDGLKELGSPLRLNPDRNVITGGAGGDPCGRDPC